MNFKLLKDSKAKGVNELGGGGALGCNTLHAKALPHYMPKHYCVICPNDATLVTHIEEVKGSKGVEFTESKGRGKYNKGSRIVGMYPKKTTHQACS